MVCEKNLKSLGSLSGSLSNNVPTSIKSKRVLVLKVTISRSGEIVNKGNFLDEFYRYRESFEQITRSRAYC
jgi:hypothetical protein